MLPNFLFHKGRKHTKLSTSASSNTVAFHELSKEAIAVSSTKGKKHIILNYILSCLGSFFTALSFIYVAFGLGELLTHFLGDSPVVYDTVFYGLIEYFGLSFAFACLSFVVIYFSNVSARKMAILEENFLRKKVLSHMFDVGKVEVLDSKTGGVFSTIIDGSEKVSFYLQTFLGQVFASFTVPFLVVVLVAVFVDWLTAVVLLVFIPLVPIIVGLFQNAFRKVSSRSRNAKIRLAGRYLEAIQGIVALRLLNAHKVMESDLAECGESNRRAVMKLLASNQLIIFVIDVVFSLFAVGITVFMATFRLFEGNVSLGQALALIFVSIVFLEPLDQVGAFFYVAMAGLASKRKIEGIFSLKTYRDFVSNDFGGKDCEENCKEVSRGLDLNDGFGFSQNQLLFSKGESERVGNSGFPVICVRDLCFSYSGDLGSPVLSNLCFDVFRGEKVALVGASGNGKSTLLRILKGYLLPSSGQVVVDGVVSSVDSRALLQSKSAYVSQSTWLFNMSVRENLLLVSPEASDEDLWQALALACVDDDVRLFSDGLDTVVGEQGISVSGGQAQRLSLARAFLSDRDLIILDEPTSQVDLLSEAKILESISGIAEDKTVVMVTHRFSALGVVDRVFSLNSGLLVCESGSV